MKPAEEYSVLDEPRRAFLSGWWSGIAVGCCLGLCGAVFVFELWRMVR